MDNHAAYKKDRLSIPFFRVLAFRGSGLRFAEEGFDRRAMGRKGTEGFQVHGGSF